MSGLSTANFVSGAMRGYQFGENIKDQHQARGLRESREARSVNEDKRRQEVFEMDKENHGARMDNHRQSKDIGAQNLEMNRLRINDIKGDVETKLHQARARKMRAMKGAGIELDSDSVKLFDQVSRRSDPEYLMSEPVINAVNTAERVFGGEIDQNSPEALEALDLIMDEIGRGATDGRKVKPNKVVQSRDGEGFYIGLDVTGPNGEKGEGVVTKNRSADPKDAVRKVSYDEIMPLVKEMKGEINRLSDPKYIEAYINHYDPQGQATSYGKVSTDEATGLTGQYDSTGKYHQMDSRKAGLSGRAGAKGISDKAPADYKLAKLIQMEFKQEGKDITFDEAWSKVKLAVSDPSRYVSNYVKERMAAQVLSEEQLTPKQLEDEALASYQRIRSALMPSGEQEPEPEAEAEAEATEGPTKEDDGFWGGFLDESPIPEAATREQAATGDQAPISDSELASSPNWKEAINQRIKAAQMAEQR